MRQIRKCLAVALVVGLGAVAARADVVFDFEDQSEGVPSSISSTKSGVTLDLALSGGGGFYVQDLGPYGAPSTPWGTRTVGASNTTEKFIANLSGTAAYGASLLSSDFNSDADSIHFEVWTGANATGTKLYDTTVDIAASFDLRNGQYVTFSYAGSQTIGSLRFWGVGQSGQQNLYFDNLSVSTTAVPLPPAVFAGAGLLGAIGAWRRRRRA